MAKIQLTIKTTYVSNWGIFEGVRELLQNAKDAEVEHNSSMNVSHRNDTLYIENTGATLPTKALLLGHTSKSGNSSMIGLYGEGLKLGCLALIRSGLSVKIRNGAEVWIPSIERSSVFDDNVLTFEILSGRKEENRVRIEVKGISASLWSEMKSKFLFLEPDTGKIAKTGYGELLLNEKYKGKIFVKGIFVQDLPDTKYGFNLFGVTVDRDRKMIESYNLKYYIRNVFLSACNNSKMHNEFLDSIKFVTAESESISDYDISSISDDLSQYVLDDFYKDYGKNAVPVSSLSESKEVEHQGKRGIIVSKPMQVVLSKKLGTFNEISNSLKKETLIKYSWGDLDEQEKYNLDRAIQEINTIEPITIDSIDVCKFKSKELKGLFHSGTYRIELSKELLTDYVRTLGVLIHEVSHRYGGDGEHDHASKMHEIWEKVYRNAIQS